MRPKRIKIETILVDRSPNLARQLARLASEEDVLAGSQEYRSIADVQRKIASHCNLEFVRDMHLASAARLEAIAAEIEAMQPRRSAVPEMIY